MNILFNYDINSRTTTVLSQHRYNNNNHNNSYKNLIIICLDSRSLATDGCKGDGLSGGGMVELWVDLYGGGLVRFVKRARFAK